MIQAVPPPPGFDPNVALSQVAPIIGTVAVVIALVLGARWLLGSPVGEALAERIRQGSSRRRHWKGFGGEWSDVPGEGAVGATRVAALEEQVHLLSSQVSELAERLDFAERLLTERREPKHIEGPHGNL